ncbi:hypothetical protein H7E67_18005 [Clostridium gasigenes]|uniref:hypothetical protein n=1 Tax=Clostridium gasigenes TaxID=94869 RepID=UPI001625257A|nr:hypothetical protein [Clostridium gasigenes]MBB6625313.1 hypothetical protein [Clostridium gasigenes]
MKKYFKTLTIFCVILLLIILGDVVLNKTYKIKYDSLNQIDQKMFKELSLMYKNFQENPNELWDDTYRLNEKPIIVIRTNKDNGVINQYAYAINMKKNQNNLFSKKIDMGSTSKLPDVYRLSKFNTNIILKCILGNFGTVQVDNEDVFYFKYYTGMMENPKINLDFSSFLLHESFHTYKQKKWRYDKNDAENIPNYPANKENYALMGLEFSLLDKCMESDDINIVKESLKEWVTVREYRYKKWPQLIGETKTEAIEGTARYMEYKYSKLIGGNLRVIPKKEEPYYITFMDAYKFIANDQAESPTYLERPMRYETGASLGLIMDKTNINWKSDIEDSEEKDGKTQYEIIKKYFSVDNSYIIDEKIKEIENANNYNSLLEDGEKIVNLIR